MSPSTVKIHYYMWGNETTKHLKQLYQESVYLKVPSVFIRSEIKTVRTHMHCTFYTKTSIKTTVVDDANIDTTADTSIDISTHSNKLIRVHCQSSW